MISDVQNLIFPLVGVIVSLVVAGYYVYQIKDVRGLFRGNLDSYFSLIIEYSAVSGLLVMFFFLTLLIPGILMQEVLSNIFLADLVFLSLSAIWITLAYKMFGELESMSDRYFSGGSGE